MRFMGALTELWCKPTLLMPEMHRQICQIVDAHVNGTAHGVGGTIEQFLADYSTDRAGWCKDEDGAWCGMIDGIASSPIPGGVSVQGDIATVYIHGVIAKRVSGIQTASGMSDVTNIQNAISFAEGDESVSGVLFDIDSPGGSVTGTPELGAMVKAMTKPTVTFVDSMMASAAYWVGSQTDAIFASRSAKVGSIGVYMAWLDASRAFEMQGLRAEVIKSGKFKATGIKGTSLTDDQRALLQAGVDKVNGWFAEAVIAGRGKVNADAMDGQAFFGDDALTENLIDAVGSAEDALAELRGMIDGR